MVSKSRNDFLGSLKPFATFGSVTTGDSSLSNAFRVALFLLITVAAMNIVGGTSEIGGSTAEIEESQSRVESTANIVGPLRRTCFTADDLTVIEAQRNFERIIPEREKIFKSLNDTAIKKQISFFTALEKDTVQAIENPKIKELVGLALANTVGGYLYGYYVPIMKHSYYGGFVSYSSAIEVIRLLRKYQNVIGVHGEGSLTSQSWELQELDQKIFFERIAPITNAELHNASHNCHDGSGLHLIPSLEIDVETNELLLISFSRHHHNGYVANPRSKNASQAVLRHYINTVKCLEGKREPLDTFNQAISAWLAKNMGYILSNQTTLLYPAFEGMLRIVKTVENGLNLLKQSAAVENLDPDETDDDDFSILADGPDEEERRLTSMSIGQKISIWVGCSLTVLLVVYILFKLRHNRKIISNNRLTHRRGKSVSVRSRRASRRRMPRSVSEEEEVTLFDRQEVDTNADDAPIQSRSKRKSSLARLLHKMHPRTWRSRSKGYQPTAVDGSDGEVELQTASGRVSQRVDDDPQPGPSGINSRTQPSRSCSCISCIERESSSAVASKGRGRDFNST